MSATLVQALAGFCHAPGPLPTEVRDSVRRRVLDVAGLCAAAVSLDTSQAVVRHVRRQGGTPAARAAGVPEALPAAQAALVNGVLAHSLDYDDTHLPSVLHPSASVVPAAVAVAEEVAATGDDLIRAVAVGLEVCVRLGMAGYDRDAGSSVFFDHGQHATSICGTLASAAAAARLYGADADGIAHAVGIAASMAGGVIEANRTGGTVKRLHCGWAAHAGVTAAGLAQEGITGPPTVLEGRFGFFEAFLRGEVDEDAVTEGLGQRWEVPRIFFKPYPANHFVHTAVDAARRLRERGLDAEDVAGARLGVASATVRTIGEPIDVKRAPQTGYQAQFSGPYAVVVGLVGGSGLGLGLDDVTDELAGDPRRRRLMQLVDVVADPECDRIFPAQFPATLTIRTHDGATLVERVHVNRGGPDDPLSDEELLTKFEDNAGRSMAAGDVAELATRLLRLEELSDLTEVTSLLARAGTA